jgi:polyhydroxyalkanoate synthesis regulator phasin
MVMEVGKAQAAMAGAKGESNPFREALEVIANLAEGGDFEFEEAERLAQEAFEQERNSIEAAPAASNTEDEDEEDDEDEDTSSGTNSVIVVEQPYVRDSRSRSADKRVGFNFASIINARNDEEKENEDDNASNGGGTCDQVVMVRRIPVVVHATK